MRDKAAEEAAARIACGEDIHVVKREISSKYGINPLRNSEILAFAVDHRVKLINKTRLRPTRTLSGVAPIAVMSRSSCPHGSCSYCPRGENAAQSYTGYEPASLRARQNDFDPYKQVRARIEQLNSIGHSTQKCELIIMGGTFNSNTPEFQKNFVKRCLDALNGIDSQTLDEAQRINEKAKSRAVGLTLETRPDWAKEKDVDMMLELGATRVELGVQTLRDEVYIKVRRGHTVADVIEATRICKDAGLKVCYHMMPGLFSSPEEDIAMFRELFENKNFRPDMLKIYPCLVVKGTELYEMWKRGEYTPYTDEEAADVIAKAMRFVPEYVRVMRIQRDIPSNLVECGVKKSNLRQIVERKMMDMGIACKCIRCREAGLKKEKPENVSMRRLEYSASGGTEIFLSIENERALFALLRLRIPNKPHRTELKDAAIVRELHTYGASLPLGERDAESTQHRGYGMSLLEEAERISQEFGKKKLAVLSGVGAREYYYKQGYVRDGPYVSKNIT